MRNDLEFKVDNWIRNKDGLIYKIVSICDCEECKKRGFFEPILDNGDCITIYEYEHDFPDWVETINSQDNVIKEIHIWMCGGYPIEGTDCDMYLTSLSLQNENPIVHTTQPHFCSTRRFEEGYRLFVHLIDSSVVEIKLGTNECTGREIKQTHNLEKLLLANEFGKAVEVYE